jgi:hypothetical protein
MSEKNKDDNDNINMYGVNNNNSSSSFSSSFKDSVFFQIKAILKEYRIDQEI